MRPIFAGFRRTLASAGRRIRTVGGGGGAAAAPDPRARRGGLELRELAPLLPGRRLLIPDLPGHGASTPLAGRRLPRGLRGCARRDAREAPWTCSGTRSAGGRAAPRGAAPRARPQPRARGGGRDLELDPQGRVTITLPAIVQPGRIAARRAGRIARSPRLRRLVFGGFEVANPDLLTERAVHGFCTGDAAHGHDRRGPGAVARRPAPGSRPGSLPGARPLGRARPAGAGRGRLRVRHAACARRFA